jgi:hypothetical protein
MVHGLQPGLIFFADISAETPNAGWLLVDLIAIGCMLSLAPVLRDGRWRLGFGV